MEIQIPAFAHMVVSSRCVIESETSRLGGARSTVAGHTERPCTTQMWFGLGPDVVQARNPKLVYGRMTGWGQEGPLAKAAGHDINYIALTGALHAIGGKDKPVPPLNPDQQIAGGGRGRAGSNAVDRACASRGRPVRPLE